MKKLVLLALLLALFSGCKEVKISGTVLKEDSTPAAGITVSVDGYPDIATVTDGNGKFLIKSKKIKPEDAGKKMLLLSGSEGVGKMPFAISKDSPEVFLSATYPVINNVVFLHINDEHGAIDTYGKIAALFKEERKANKDVFTVNAGDLFSGNPVVDQAQDKGKPLIDLMNVVKFDLFTIGNHDFDYGPEVMKKRLGELAANGTKIISANIKKTGETIIPEPKPFTSITLENGIKMSFVGLIETSNSGLPSTHPKNVVGLTFKNPIDTANEFAYLKKESDALILLSHLGIESDVMIADKLPEYDAIIGAHSHTLIKNQKIQNGVLITQAGSDSKYVGKIILKFSNGKLKSKTSTIVTLKDYTNTDEATQKKIDEFNADPYLNTVIATNKTKLTTKGEIGSFICEATRVALNLDVVFQNNGGIRSSKIDAGDIKLKDVYELLPFSNEIVKINMTTNEIRSLLTFSFKKRDSLDLQASGLTYKINVQDKTIVSIDLLDMSGKPLDETKTYAVGFTSYIADSYKFDHQDAGTATGVADNTSMIDYLKAVKVVDFKGANHAFLVQQ